MADESKPDIFHHVVDSTEITIFETIGWKLHLPTHQQIHDALPSWLHWFADFFFPYGFTKFMFLELIAAAVVFLLVVPVLRRLRTGEPPRGLIGNAVEGLLLFIRDEVARASIPDEHHHDDHAHAPDAHGAAHRDVTPHEQARDNAGGAYAPPGPDLAANKIEHRADYYLPLLWTLFLFIVVCNLLGMLPFSGSPTASLMVSGALSIITFIVIHAAGVINNGWSGYAKSFVPHIEGEDSITKILRPFIVVGVTAIEIMSLFIRNIVLAVRLFANMVGGHTALFLMLLFIQLIGKAAEVNPGMQAPDYLFWPVTIGSVILVTAMSLLELFVALLQAYVFTMLTATFIGLAVAPEH